MKDSRIGLKTYWNMLIQKGWRLPIKFFCESHWYDIRRCTDTHNWRPKELEVDNNHYPQKSDGIMYMASWTGDLKYWIEYLQTYLGEEFKKFQFIDVGCGKGKPCLVYSELLLNKKEVYNPIGIDYSEENIKIAVRNSSILSHKIKNFKQPNFILGEASNLPNYIRTDSLILYLYNPFTGRTFNNFLNSIKKYKCLLIYNTPEMINSFDKERWRLLKTKKAGNYSEVTSYLLSNYS